MCPYMNLGSEILIRNGSKFTVKTSMTCVSSNLIYLITCAGCGENYIVQAGDTLRHRMTVHRQQIREPKCQCASVSEHIRDYAANIHPNFFRFSHLQILQKHYRKRTQNKRKTIYWKI
jgi:hypothetical protein